MIFIFVSKPIDGLRMCVMMVDFKFLATNGIL